MRRWLPIGMVLVGVAAWAAWAASSAADARAPQREPGKLTLQGAGSCAAAACHNAGETNRVPFLGREYSLALQRDFTAERPRVKDKHADAYAVLFGERSQRMVRRWRGLADNAVVQPQREALCLRCHVHPDFDQQPVQFAGGNARFQLADGVSCEACHGPAERWLAVHFRPEWKKLTAAERSALGITDTRSVVGRVKVCVDCHVGGPSAEVDHDLIAAGHPWLQFDASAYHDRWHRHWDSAKDSAAHGAAGFTAKLKLAGQAAAAQAVLRRLADRASASAGVWPELAYYDCKSCHHDLQASGELSPSKTRPGAPRLNAWHLQGFLGASADAYQALATPDELAKLATALRAVQDSMTTWRPRRAEVASQAKAAADIFGQWLTRWE